MARVVKFCGGVSRYIGGDKRLREGGTAQRDSPSRRLERGARTGLVWIPVRRIKRLEMNALPGIASVEACLDGSAVRVRPDGTGEVHLNERPSLGARSVLAQQMVLL
jgi:hypothetical protein